MNGLERLITLCQNARLAIVFCALLNHVASATEIEHLNYRQSAGHLLIEYSLDHSMIAEPDPIPALRIYGDGRVLVHRPAYMKNPGDFEMMLSPGALQKLLKALVDDGVMSFQDRDVRTMELAKANELGVEVHISDRTTARVTIHLDSVSLRGRANPEMVGRRELVLENINARAKTFSTVDALSRFNRALQKFDAMCRSPQLRHASP